MTTSEERRELMQIAEELLKELRTITYPINLVINKLIETADSLMVAAADEKVAGEHITKKILTYGKTYGASPETIQKFIGTPPIGPGKRACSLCRQPGHRATNCPNAHLIQQNKKAAVELRGSKKRGKK